MGLPERQCNNDTIIRNSHINGTSVAKTLKEIDKFTGPFRLYRNTVAHQSTYSERELDRLGSYYFLVEEDDSFERYQYLCKKKTDDFVADKKVEFKNNVAKLETLVQAYFNALIAIFESKLKSYV